jgi:hypothetical protein
VSALQLINIPLCSSSADVYHALDPLTQATHYGHDAPSGCLEGTRVKVLKELKDWATADGIPELSSYWMRAMAGTGKTTIAKSFAVEMESVGYLGASFFIQHAREVTRNPRKIVQTLAFDLANLDYRRMDSLLTILRNQPNIVTWPLEKQIYWLIKKPFESSPPDEALVIVIDSLDEAMHSEPWDVVLNVRYAGADLIVKLASALSEFPIKLFFTSRNEPEIAQELIRVKHSLFDLQNHQFDVSHDLKIYYETHFDKICEHPKINMAWRSIIDLATLLKRTGALFIYAATVVRLVQSDIKRNPFKKLQSLLDTDIGTYDSGSASGLLTDLYQRILEDAVKDRLGGIQRDSDVALIIEGVLQYIAYSYEPLSVNAVVKLLGLDDSDGEDLLVNIQGLSTVLVLPDEHHLDDLILPLHESFPDFLRSCKLDQPFKLPFDWHLSHHRLAEACLKLVLSAARKSDENISDSNLGFSYAATAWPRHMSDSKHTCNEAQALLSESAPEHLKLESTFSHICNKKRWPFMCESFLRGLLRNLWVSKSFASHDVVVFCLTFTHRRPLIMAMCK